MARAQNDFVQDSEATNDIGRQATMIRAAGAAAGVLLDVVQVRAAPNRALHDGTELETALRLLKPGKSVTHGSYAALRAKEPCGRRLSLGLVNLGRHLCVTSVHWSLRTLRGLRKSGPRIVRRVRCLRGISIATDMASLQDAFWVGRNSDRLASYAGADQHGGVGDPVLVVLAIVLIAQLREFQGMDTWLAFADLQWAFDVADIPAMLVNAYLAGVSFEDWLILDDILSQDYQCASIGGLISSAFVLACGTAQGRRFSIQVFNSLLRWLADEVRKVQPSDCSAWLLPFAWRVLEDAYVESLPDLSPAPPTLHACPQ